MKKYDGEGRRWSDSESGIINYPNSLIQDPWKQNYKNEVYPGFKRSLSEPLLPVRREPTLFDALMDMQIGETVEDALERLRREIQAEEDKRNQEFLARMAAAGVVVEPMAPGDPLARIDLEPVGRRGQDDKDSGTYPYKITLKEPKWPLIGEEPKKRHFSGEEY